MAVARWRQMRLWALEKSALDDEIRRQQPDTENRNGPTRAFLAFRGICDQSRSLELINRYETRFDRQFLRLVRHFIALLPRFSLRRASAQKIKNFQTNLQQGAENNEAA